MARTIDLRGKLGLGEKPRILLDNNVVLTFNDSVPNLRRVIESLRKGNQTLDEIVECCGLMFDKPSFKRLMKLDLSLDGFTAVLAASVEAIIGGEDDGGDEGNSETPATT